MANIDNRKPCVEFITGIAGSGKSFELMRRSPNSNSRYGLMTATTGISAVNLGTRTLNSVLRYYDTESLEERYERGQLHDRLLDVQKEHDNLLIDEVSMLSARQLDLIYDSLCELHRDYPEDWSLGLVVSGDFLQLPPVNERWAFQANCWPEFDANTTKLEGTKRQNDPEFLAGLNYARSGQGLNAAQAFKRAGVTFVENRIEGWNGTLILAKNLEVEKHNALQLQKLPNQELIKEKIVRWGKSRPEWKYIADYQEFKVGAYVMILANDTPLFTYANGDCGWIRSYDPLKHAFTIELARNGQMVEIQRIERFSYIPRNLTGKVKFKLGETETDEEERAQDTATLDGVEVRFDYATRRWAMGSVVYYPIRLAYASTVHKCVSGDTRIPVIGKGWIKAEELAGGMITPYGKVLAVSESFQKMFRITTQCGYEVLCSGDHKWVLRTGLKETAEIAPGDEVEIAAIPSFPGTNELSDEFAWWLGALIGDGSYTNQSEGQHFGCASEKSIGERYKRYKRFIESQGLHIRWRKDDRGLHSKPFREGLLSLGLDYEKGPSKSIPDVIWRSGPSTWSSFLSGLFDTDGHVGKSFVVLTIASTQLAKEVQLLLLGLGIVSKRRMWKGGRGENRSSHWQVFIGASLSKFQTKVGFSHPTKAKKLASLSPNRYIRFDGYDAVKSVEYLVEHLLFDIEIPEPHILSFSGLMGHNCQGLSLDRVMVDPHDGFFGKPAMVYVAVSRARTPEGLVIVGGPLKFASQVRSAPEVGRFI